VNPPAATTGVGDAAITDTWNRVAESIPFSCATRLAMRRRSVTANTSVAKHPS
jgi:hypothetical protein